MSRFIDKLNRVSESTPQPMGFRADQPASEKPRILLIASLTQANIDGLADRVTGADAGLLRNLRHGGALQRGSSLSPPSSNYFSLV